jgi:hypothetical protein
VVEIPSLSCVIMIMVSSVINGPLLQATGPNDHDGLGRERFWDMTPEQRRDNLKQIVADSNAGALEAPRKEFARGWLSELERYRRHNCDPLGS